jgi:threonine/homoserine/homoserine lactone efflux protein
MESYFFIWKVLGGAFLVFLAYALFVVRKNRREGN